MAQALRAGLRNGGIRRGGLRPGLGNGSLFAVAPLDLFFARNRTLDPRVTFTRASSGTYVGSDGVLKTATTNEPRFDHNPTTGESLGLLVEGARTNLLLNSGTLSTQNVTVTAAAHTLSFTGTGTITLSGTSTAGPLIGTGTGEANRVSLTFTPTAGTLTLTVSGTVTNAQLEAGSFRTSYIPTTTATATRSADVASITGTNFSSWYRQDEGTVFADWISSATTDNLVWTITEGTFNESMYVSALVNGAGNNTRPSIIDGGVSQVSMNLGVYLPGTKRRAALAYQTDNIAAATDGNTLNVDASATLPTVNRLIVGGSWSGGLPLCGTISRLTYFPARLPNPTLQAITQ